MVCFFGNAIVLVCDLAAISVFDDESQPTVERTMSIPKKTVGLFCSGFD